ncbi:MAG: glycosyltransferase family 39 protein [Saprospiraceae bacterium]|nr:glycosyltransferase family 39 protein [Saprospiraceae bacterium]
MANYRFLFPVALIALSTALHAPHFQKELMSIHVWRQTQTESTSVLFYEEDFDLFNPRRNDRGDGDGLFRMEFPLLQWLTAGLYKLFGRHLVLSRLFNFIIGLFSVWGMYALLRAVFHHDQTAFAGAWAFNWSPSFFYYTINPMPDNLALCFGLWGLYFFRRFYTSGGAMRMGAAGGLLALSALCKLPFILFFIVPLACFLSVVFRRRLFLTDGHAFIWMLICLSLPLGWYLSVVPHWHGNGIVQGMLNRQTTWNVLLDYAQHNLFSTLPELMLNYASVPFFIIGVVNALQKKRRYSPQIWIWGAGLAAVAAYALFELNMIAKIHDYYLFPLYPYLFLVVALGIHTAWHGRRPWLRTATLALLLCMPLTAWLRMQSRWNPEKPGFNADLLRHQAALRNAVPKDALVVAGNDLSHFIFLYYIDKKGWGFHADQLDSAGLHERIRRGARYLYSDSREVERVAAPFLDTLVLQAGTVHVFRLNAPVR